MPLSLSLPTHLHNSSTASKSDQKMNPRTRPLFLFLLTLVLLLHKSLSLNPHYVDCQPQPCGSLNISYPFYLPSTQPSFCGSQGFELRCNPERTQATILLSEDEYVINSIDYTALSINITNSAFASPVFGCLSSVHNLNLDPDSKFNFTYKHKELLLLHKCSSKNITNSKNYTKIMCKEEDQTILAVYENDFSQGDVGNCNETVKVAYEGDRATTVDGIEGLLRRGITLEYSTNNCSACQSSGGRCGFNQNTSTFFCACPDRDHTGHCHKSRNTWKIILATVIPGSAVLALLIICWIKRKKKSNSSTLPTRSLSFSRLRTDLEVGTMNGVTIYSYTELEEATNNFDPDKQLGEGGFGVVYYGKLRDGREVAVKRLYEKSYKRIEQFKNEIRILTDLRHQNLVTLYGCTSRHTRELLLVYEYIPNGTVADHLHGEKANSRLLPWSTRMNIAIETATALSYLHFKDIIHRDVKTNNILLDNNFSVKVADFGLSRLFPTDVTHVSTAPQGTPGYVDPEYHQCYHLTNKSDVYSFGVVLIELISSLLAVDVGRERYEINLSNYAMNRIQSSVINELVDPNLGFETDFKVRRMTTLVAELASQCLQHDREVRPSMEEVLETLKNIASGDYDALEAEETNWSGRTMQIPKPPPSPNDKDDIELLRNTRKPPPPSPVSVMDNWLSSSKSTTPNTSKST